jgi:beta-lactamase class A
MESGRRAGRSASTSPISPENDGAALEGVPEDLLNFYPEKLAVAGLKPLEEESIYLDELPKVDPPDIPSPEPVQDDVPILQHDSMHKGLARAQRAIEGYEGEVGLYVRDLEEGWGYGIRADEVFFSASVIKVPIMIAVYRKIDEGELSLQDTIPTLAEDWAAGAGWLQWEPLGEVHTVQDYLWMMMTQSDNVATNALVRAVGGPDYVNEVAESLGAENTVLYQKVTSERAAVTALDNRSTPHDMATLMQKIGAGEASSPESCEKMVELMRQNVHEPWLEGGVPEGVEVANKAGWLYRVHNEVGLVFHQERPYAVAILSKHGPSSSEQAGSLLSEISEALCEAQSEG